MLILLTSGCVSVISAEWNHSGGDTSSGFHFRGSTTNFTSQIYGVAAGQVEFRLRSHPANCKGSVMDVCVEHGGSQPAQNWPPQKGRMGRTERRKSTGPFQSVDVEAEICAALCQGTALVFDACREQMSSSHSVFLSRPLTVSRSVRRRPTRPGRLETAEAFSLN